MRLFPFILTAHPRLFPFIFTAADMRFTALPRLSSFPLYFNLFELLLMLVFIDVAEQFAHFFLTVASLRDELFEELSVIGAPLQHLGQFPLHLFVATVEQFCKLFHNLGHFVDRVEGLERYPFVIDDFSDHC
jgi:hypothetical protein